MLLNLQPGEGKLLGLVLNLDQKKKVYDVPVLLLVLDRLLKPLKEKDQNRLTTHKRLAKMLTVLLLLVRMHAPTSTTSVAGAG